MCDYEYNTLVLLVICEVDSCDCTVDIQSFTDTCKFNNNIGVSACISYHEYPWYMQLSHFGNLDLQSSESGDQYTLPSDTLHGDQYSLSRM